MEANPARRFEHNTGVLQSAVAVANAPSNMELRAQLEAKRAQLASRLDAVISELLIEEPERAPLLRAATTPRLVGPSGAPLLNMAAPPFPARADWLAPTGSTISFVSQAETAASGVEGAEATARRETESSRTDPANRAVVRSRRQPS